MPRQLKYEVAIKLVEKLAAETNHPLFILNVLLIISAMRERRPPTTPLSLQLIRMSVRERAAGRIDSCRTLLLTALAVVNDRTLKMLSSFAGRVLKGYSYSEPKAKTSISSLPPIPQLPGVPKAHMDALNKALSKIDPANLPEGKSQVQTAVGPLNVVKVKNPMSGGGDPRLN
jgi:hypothetical protein